MDFITVCASSAGKIAMTVAIPSASGYQVTLRASRARSAVFSNSSGANLAIVVFTFEATCPGV